MRSLRYIAAVLREFWAHWISYLVLSGVVGILISLLIIPALRWVTRAVLVAGGVPYLTLTNAPSVIVNHPFTSIALLAIGILLLVLVYLQFAVLLTGVNNIHHHENYGWRQIARAVWSDLRHLRWTSFVFFAPYCLIVVPLAGLVVGSSLLAKVRVPIFITAWLIERPPLAVAVAGIYLVMTYLAVRWLRVLPHAILGEMHLRAAARQSWRETRGRWWFFFIRATLLGITVWLIAYAWSEGLIGLQNWFDDQKYAYVAAIITMALMIIGKVVLGAMGSIALLLFLIEPDQLSSTTKATVKRHHGGWFYTGISVTGVLALALLILFNAVYLKGALDSQPLAISHRGVDNGNGVQNTLPAMERTAKEHPDYIEIDVHETKDNQFIVLHDENLKQLAGINKTPKQLTLKQLQRVVVHENGHHAHLVSLNQYMAAAEKRGQKLIVEIKTTKNDSRGMLTNFIDRYAQRIIAHHDRVHSLNYGVITGLRRRVPHLYASFILPYVLVFPKTDANAYTFEETTLDDVFVDAAHDDHQAVWAWTVNDADSMEQMMFIGVDGIITDNLSLLQNTIRTHDDHPSYAERMQFFSNSLDNISAQSEVD